MRKFKPTKYFLTKEEARPILVYLYSDDPELNKLARELFKHTKTYKHYKNTFSECMFDFEIERYIIGRVRQ